MRIGQSELRGDKLLQDFKHINKMSEVNSFSLFRLFGAYTRVKRKELMKDIGYTGRGQGSLSDYIE